MENMKVMMWKPRAPAMSKAAMREETERLMKEAKNIPVTRGKTHMDVKCSKCGSPNRVSADAGQSRVVSRIALIDGAFITPFDGRDWRNGLTHADRCCRRARGVQDQAFGGPRGPVLSAPARVGSLIVRLG